MFANKLRNQASQIINLYEKSCTGLSGQALAGLTLNFYNGWQRVQRLNSYYRKLSRQFWKRPIGSLVFITILNS